MRVSNFRRTKRLRMYEPVKAIRTTILMAFAIKSEIGPSER